MSRARTPRLDDAALHDAIAAIPAWVLTDGALRRTFVLADFDGALAALDRVAELARERDHHPDVTIVWNRLTLDLRSHDAGGITARDVDLARAIDGIAASFAAVRAASAHGSDRLPP